MAVCIIMEFPGMDAGQYEALMNELRLRGVNPALPNGILSNVVGFTRDRAHLVTVWNAQHFFDDFLENRLRPALEVVGGSLQPRIMTFDVYKSYTASAAGQG